MGDATNPVEVVEDYLQSDHAVRATRFAAFIQALKSIASSGGSPAAHPWAARAISPHLSYSSAMTLRRWLAPAGAAGAKGGRLRLAVLGGPSTVQLVQLVEAFLAAEGIAAEIFEAEYGVFRQEILTCGSALDKFGPQVVFLATGSADIARHPVPEMSLEAVIEVADAEWKAWAALWETANRRWSATVIQNNFEAAPAGVFGHYALRHPAARSNYLDRLNRRFAESAPRYVVLHDLCALAAEAGTGRWFDPRFYYEAKMPCAADGLVAYAHSAVSLLRALSGKSRKVLVLDLDNTLWGGQVGDAGPEGIVLGQGSAEGEAYLAFQHFVKQLHDRGIVLAVCSKNEEDTARKPFLTRNDMVLGLSDISYFIANWQNKVDNIREIAARLGLGLDSFVFFDDNPVERALVRRYLPAVAVPDVPEDPAGYVAALQLHRYFEMVTYTAEDAARAHYYGQNERRREMQAQATDLESFLASLKMRAKIEEVNVSNLERSAQLINKSNQFNLTTRRYSAAELQTMTRSGDWHTLTLSLRDQLGDNGLISVLLLRRQADTLEIDTWVMSCRVLQRGVERLARNEITRVARAAGAGRIRGVYIPTPKNALVRDHYAGLGFEPDGSGGRTTYWVLALTDPMPPLATHIELEPSHG